jgi:hypothetical protein
LEYFKALASGPIEVDMLFLRIDLGELRRGVDLAGSGTASTSWISILGRVGLNVSNSDLFGPGLGTLVVGGGSLAVGLLYLNGLVGLVGSLAYLGLRVYLEVGDFDLIYYSEIGLSSLKIPFGNY